MDRIRFPALDHLAGIRQAFAADRPFVIVEAETGTGKSTALVRELARWRVEVDQAQNMRSTKNWYLAEESRLLLVEPRRLAARNVASFIDRELRDQGDSTAAWSLAGYMTRFDSRTSQATRVLSITGGVLLRRLFADPFFTGYDCIVLDEFHERSLDTDFALAWCLGLVRELRPELRVMILSATMDSAGLSAHIDRAMGRSASLICRDTESGRRRFPLDIRYSTHNALRDPIPAVTRAIRDSLSEEGDLLVFLPGMREIRGVERQLATQGLSTGPKRLVHVLHGDVDPARQAVAMQPDPNGRRRIILSTTIAESSLTIEGVRLVIDSGLVNLPLHEHARGLTRLVTQPISLASADQRAGRAARTAAGIAWRLWTRGDERSFVAQTRPEIEKADLAALVLGLGAAGVEMPALKDWLDPPPEASLVRAQSLLSDLGACLMDGSVTELGRRMVKVPLHPRFARMLVAAQTDPARTATAAAIAALLDERDILPPGAPPWIEDRLELLLSGRGARLDQGLRRVRHLAAMLARRAGVKLEKADPDLAGQLLAMAWPERIALKTGHAWLLAAGGQVELPVATSGTMLVVPDIESRGDGLRVRLAASLSREDFERMFGQAQEGSGLSCTRLDTVCLDADGRPRAFSEVRFGALILSRTERRVEGAAERAALIAGGLAEELQSRGSILPEAACELLARLAFLREAMPDETSDWPASDEAGVVAAAPVLAEKDLADCRSLEDAHGLDWTSIIRRMIGRERMALLEREAPAMLLLPSGIRSGIRYDRGTGPTVSLRLQQVFGMREHPRLAGGRMPVALELLSPAGRPVQITRDIVGFWRGSYAAVRKDMRGRYPKHNWPEDGASAQPGQRQTRQPPAK